MPMTNTQRKLERARYFLRQAKNAANNYDAFISNLEAFVMNLNSVWDVVMNEFNSIPEFNQWYDKKEHELFASPIIKFFRKKRQLTEDIKPFDAEKDDKSFYTSFDDGFIVRGGATIGYPMPTKDKKGKVKYDDKSLLLIDGKPVKVKRKTSVRYYFAEHPSENVFVLCDAYFNIISDVISECHEKFRLSDRKKGKKAKAFVTRP